MGVDVKVVGCGAGRAGSVRRLENGMMVFFGTRCVSMSRGC